MSVPVSQRKESLLIVITKTRDLFSYCVRICCNEKNFPKRYRWLVTDGIIKLVSIAHQEFVCANSVYIVNQQTYNKRRELQSNGMSMMVTAIGQIELCFQTFHVPARKASFLLAVMAQIISLARKWQKSDEERYPQYFANFNDGYDIGQFVHLSNRILAANDINSFFIDGKVDPAIFDEVTEESAAIVQNKAYLNPTK